MKIQRRDFIRGSAAAAATIAIVDDVSSAKDIRNGIPYRELGTTGERVSLLGIGGNDVARDSVPEQECLRIVRTAVDQGLNFLDTAASYGHGLAEERYGKALRDGYRDKVFLMTKSRLRNGKGAREELEKSLRRLQTDRVDLWQVHAVESPEDIDQVYAEDGVLPVAISAQEQGLVRYIGFTGHDYPDVHAECIERGHAWATVQMPLNPFDPHYLSFERRVLPLARDKGIGIIAMKTLGHGNLLKSGIVTAEECLRYAMSLPTSTVVSGIDSLDLLERNLRTVRAFETMTVDEMRTLRSRTKKLAAPGEFEPYKAGA